MGGRLIFRIWAVLAAITLIGCSKPLQGSPVEYPEGWPLESLKAPAGSIAFVTRIPGIWGGQSGEQAAFCGVESLKGWTVYYIGFRSNRGWKANERQFTQRMQSMGFAIGKQAREFTVCKSASGTTEAMLYSWDEYHAGDTEDYVLAIRKREN